MKSEHRIKYLIFLHIILFVESITGVISKFASQQKFMSLNFILLYGLMIMVLGIYAICWQQAIKRLPLTMAYTNKAVTVLWGIVFGRVFFNETITIKKIIGAVIIAVGIILFVKADKEVTNE